MACHLAHRIPWQSLCEMYLLSKRPLRENEQLQLQLARQLQHAARCFAQVLQEFQQTDWTTDEDREFYDPATWDRYEYADGGEYMDVYDSLRILPRMMPHGVWPKALRVLAGEASGAHPDEMADHLRQAFDDHGRLRPLTADVVQTLRDHAALMLRYMYSARGGNRLLQESEATRHFFRFFGYRPPSSMR